MQEARGGACVRYAEEVTGRKKKSMRVGDTPAGCTVGGTDTDNCAASACNVQIGNTLYCSQCKANYVPIDGTCTAAGDANTKAKCKKDASNELTGTEQVCGACKDGYFLHKGGCYQFGGEVGKLICTDPSTSDGSLAAGACTACAAGYYKNPTQAADKPPCIACNDETGDGTNKGKAGCATCEPRSGSGVAKCTACLGGFFGTGSDDLTCTACTDLFKTCKGANNKCTSCNDGATPYFKEGADGDGTGTCVTEGDCKTGSTHFPTTTTDGKKLCTFCSEGSFLIPE